jgi:enamine deaminase RidA (YjgF/YER057c/UK114 family)
MEDPRQLHFSNPAGVAPPVGSYSHAAMIPSGVRLIVLAGQIGMRPDGSIAKGFAAQFEAALENVTTILRAQGAGPEHVVKLNTWIVQGTPIDYNEVTTIRERLLGDVKPPSTLAYVSHLFSPDLLVELEAWAATPE